MILLSILRSHISHFNWYCPIEFVSKFMGNYLSGRLCVCNRWLHNNIDCSNHILWGGWKRCIVYHVNDYLHKGKILGLCAVIFLIHFSIAKRYRCNEYVCQFVGKKAVKHISNWHINERARVHQDNSHTDRARDCNWTRHHKLALSLELTWKCLSLSLSLFFVCVCAHYNFKRH